ncbi:hypothetical protein [Sphingomonas sp.]|jgi:hypothetical protein|uniref:hypothetical protein n=1 Tax=Sphingomonas sp. TaxID=28214 RepID=UPI002ED84920
MKPGGWILLAIVALALLGGSYAYGRSDGAAIERDKQAEIAAAVLLERAGRELKVDQLGAGQARAEAARAGSMREIYRETNTVTERPVYRNVCIDADGVQLLESAAATANGANPGVGPADAGAPSPAAPQ